jgi:hypothetical protein
MDFGQRWCWSVLVWHSRIRHMWAVVGFWCEPGVVAAGQLTVAVD